jgi:hypothetical protein
MTFRRLYKIHKALVFIGHKRNVPEENICYYQFHEFENTAAIVHQNTGNQQRDILQVLFLSYGCLQSVCGMLTFLNKCHESLTKRKFFLDTVKFQIP